MKLYRLFITLILLLCTNVLLGQRKEVMSISLDEIKGFIQQEVRYNNEEIPFLTSSLRTPKILVKEFCYFLMPIHQHGLCIDILVQR